MPSTADVVSTFKNGVHYIHSLNYVSDCVKLPNFGSNKFDAKLVKDRSAVKVVENSGSLVITIPEQHRDLYDTVVALSPIG